MARYQRTFNCKACKVQGELEEISEGLIVVECPKCHVSEFWGDENINDDLEHFTYWDQLVGEC